jgi:hypothetical protein
MFYEPYDLRIFFYFELIGKDQEADRHLGARIHIPSPNAQLISREAECSSAA